MREGENSEPGTDSALAGLRVLDLAEARGHYCGKLLADLGAGGAMGGCLSLG